MLARLIVFVPFAIIFSAGFFALLAGLRRKEFGGCDSRFINVMMGCLIIFMAVGGYLRVTSPE